MRRFVLTVSAAALALGSMAFSASAQTQQPGAASMHALSQNATPIHQAACRGFGRYCGPGFTRVCTRWRCWCRPCY